MHGELDDPKAVLAGDVGEGGELLAIAASKVAVRAEKTPAAVGLRLDLEGLVLALGVSVAGELAVALAREILAPRPAESSA